MNEVIDIAITMALCFAAWGLFYAGLHRTWGINYIEHFLVTTTYFLSVGAILLVLFWKHFVPTLSDFSPTPIIVLSVFMVAQILWYVYFPRYVKEPTAYFERYPDRYFLKIHWKRIVSKSADILSQQVFIVLLVVLLREMGLDLYRTWLAFGVLFMLLHVPLIASEWGAWPSWVFGSVVISFSVIFPTFIILVPYGFIYNIVLHWLFYSATGSIFWIRYGRSVA